MRCRLETSKFGLVLMFQYRKQERRGAYPAVPVGCQNRSCYCFWLDPSACFSAVTSELAAESEADFFAARHSAQHAPCAQQFFLATSLAAEAAQHLALPSAQQSDFSADAAAVAEALHASESPQHAATATC
jgi:hypothetical protein